MCPNFDLFRQKFTFFFNPFCNNSTVKIFLLKFIYSEKAKKFCEIFTLLLSYVVLVKSKVKISQNFVAFSEYMNFNGMQIFPNASEETRGRYIVNSGKNIVNVVCECPP